MLDMIFMLELLNQHFLASKLDFESIIKDNIKNMILIKSETKISQDH